MTNRTASLPRAVATACAAGSLFLVGCASSSPHPQPGDPAPTPAPTATSTSTSHPPTIAEIRSQVRERVTKIIHDEPSGAVSVAAVNADTGASFTAGATSGMWTASAYKLLVLVSLLQHSGSGYEGPTAAAAIENSDNAAGYSLWLEAGGNPGVESTLHALGMKHTVMGVSDPTFTRTSGSDYLKVLQALIKPGILTSSQRSYVLGLMRNVEADQRWGVGVVADKGTTFANKNGWLSVDDSNGPGETDDDLWAVTSVGVVTVHGQRVLISIFTEHQPSMGDGVALVQKLARTIVPAVSGG